MTPPSPTHPIPSQINPYIVDITTTPTLESYGVTSLFLLLLPHTSLLIRERGGRGMDIENLKHEGHVSINR